MAKLKYFTKGKKDLNIIYIRFTHGRQVDITKSTSLIVKKEYWDNNSGVVKQIAKNTEKLNLQNTLNSLKEHILNNFNRDFTKGKFINSDWLSEQIFDKFNQTKKSDLTYLIDYIDFYIQNKIERAKENNNKGFNKRTVQKYYGTIKKLKRFENKQGRRYRIIEVNLKFRKEFVKLLRDVEKLNNNSIGKHIANIKAVCRYAKSKNINIDNEIESDEFMIPNSETTFIYLTIPEIDKLYEYDFSDRPYLNNARNWLIIGVWTGARASDLLNLTTKNIHNSFIEYTSQKTNQNIIVGLHNHVVNIIKTDGFPYKISTQKYNDYIKTVCEIVGINEEVQGSKFMNITPKLKKKTFRKVFGAYKKYELVSTHIGRRSFANNHYGKLPTVVLMNITGHTTEKMFLRYIRKPAKDSADTLKEYWDKLKKENENKKETKIRKLN